LVISIAVAGFVFGREAAHTQIVGTICGLIGQESAEAIQAMIQYASNKPKTGLVSTLLGAIFLLFGAGGVVGQLQTALNAIWRVKPKPGTGLRDFIRKRFISFAMVLGVGFLLFGLPRRQRLHHRPDKVRGKLARKCCLDWAFAGRCNIFRSRYIVFPDDLQVFARR
jgi:hypothetical protein